jgi:hypothetical protein
LFLSDLIHFIKNKRPVKTKKKNIDSDRGTVLNITLDGKNKAIKADSKVIYLSLNNSWVNQIKEIKANSPNIETIILGVMIRSGKIFKAVPTTTE